MKKTAILALFLFWTFWACAQNNQPEPADLFGTWSVSYTVGGGYGYSGAPMKYFLTLYEDFRSYRVLDYGLVANETWKTDDDLFIMFDPDENTTSKFRTLSFNGRNWTYKSLADDIVYRASKVSDQPKYVPKTNLSGGRVRLEAPQSDVIAVSELYGTWKGKHNKNGEAYYFTVYPDQRLLNSRGVTGNWTVSGNKFYFYVDYMDEPFVYKTTSYSKKSWQFFSVDDNETYTAQKISDTPQAFAIAEAPDEEEPEPDKTGNIKKGVCSIYSPSYNCMVCYGTCKQDCHLCGGSGKNSNNGYDCIECGGSGKEKCDCRCRAHDGLIDVALRSKKVPCNEVLHGTWKSSLGEFSFYPNPAGNGYLVTKYSTTGSWVIEDGLLKMLFLTTLDSEWEKYYIKDFDNTTLVLRPVDGYGDYTFKKN